MTALSERLRTGFHPGLPAPMQRVPFGQECPYRAEFGIVESEAKVVVALLAAEVAQRAPATQAELNGVGDVKCNNLLAKLQRARWVEHVGTCCETRAKLWRGTERAWREFGLNGWTFTNGPAAGLKVVR